MRFWKIAPGSGGFLWVEQRENNCIAIGWNDTGDLNKYRTEEKIKKRFEIQEGGSPSQLLNFYSKIKKGDYVIVSSGSGIYGLGEITGNYKQDTRLYFSHSRPVFWKITFWEPLNEDDLQLPRTLKKKFHYNRTIVELTKDEWNVLYKAASRIKSPFKNLTNWEGLLRAPVVEQEVIILFSKLGQSLHMKIESVGTRFPDAYIRIKKNNTWVTKAAEFEINSSDFYKHGHDKNECDMIICWRDDWKKRPKSLKVVELRSELQKIL